MKWSHLKRRGLALFMFAAMVVCAPAPSAEAFTLFIPGIYFGHHHHSRHYGYHHRHRGYSHYANRRHHHGGSRHVSSGGGGGGKQMPGMAE